MKKLFWGLFFIASAVFVIINQMGYTNIAFLSLLLTILIIPIFIKSIYHVNFWGILFSIAFLIIIYKGYLNIDISNMAILFSALLGSIGLSIIFNRNHFKYHDEHFDKVIDEEDSEEINLSVNFSSSIKYINSENFKKANLKCSFGAMKVYFDNAKIEDEAIINLDVSFAGVELYIPKEWKIINNVDTSLGGIEEKNLRSIKSNKKIILKGKVSFSGIEIIYV